MAMLVNLFIRHSLFSFNGFCHIVLNSRVCEKVTQNNLDSDHWKQGRSYWWLLASTLCLYCFSCPSAYLCICSCDRWNGFLSGWNCFLSGSTNFGWSCCNWSSVDGGKTCWRNMSGDFDGGEEGRGILEELELESEVTVAKDSNPLSSSFEIGEYKEGRK